MKKAKGHKQIVNAIINLSSKVSDTPDYRSLQDELLQKVDTCIENGDTGMWMCKALLESCRDWSTCKITNLDRFKRLLLEAISHGALAPDNIVGWDWMDIAIRNNDPAEFMDDTLRFYDLLADAGEHGISGAFDIMDMIWEPENCQEED